MNVPAAQAPLLVVEHDGPVTIWRIDRPAVHNALNAQVVAELDRAVSALGARGARVVVLTGTGPKAFSAGADLGELTGLSSEQAHAVLSAGQEVLHRLERSHVPVIAAVNGLALGGGFELVLSCTFAVLAQNATLGLPETGLGLIPGYGGTQRLARAVGRPVAAHAMLTGERITAERAYALGLTPVAPVAADDLLPTARAMAAAIAARGPAAIRSVLLALRHGADMPLEAGLALESALAGLATGGAEAAEGIAAFGAKRVPDFGRSDLRQVTDHRATDHRATDHRATDHRATDDRATDDRATDDGRTST